MEMTNPTFSKSLQAVGCNAHFAFLSVDDTLQLYMEQCVHTSFRALIGWSLSTTIASTASLRTRWCVPIVCCLNPKSFKLANGIGSGQNPPNHILSCLSEAPTGTSWPTSCRCAKIYASKLGTRIREVDSGL
jgi:hypothetical protein